MIDHIGRAGTYRLRRPGYSGGKILKFPHGIIFVVLLSVFVWGCTVVLPLDPRTPVIQRPEAKLQVKLGLLINQETKATEASGFTADGSTTFVYPAGEALETIASSALLSVVYGVEKVNATHTLSPDLDGAVQILIDDAFFTIPLHVRDGDIASSTMLLKCIVYDKKGKTIATLHSRGYARRFIRISSWGGFIPSILKELLGPIADQALQRAMSELLTKLLEDEKIKRLGSLAFGNRGGGRRQLKWK